VTSNEDFLREEIQWLEARRAQWPAADDPALRIMRAQDDRRVDWLHSELEAALSATLQIHLEAKLVKKPTIRTGVLGHLLSRLQSSLDYTTWAVHAGPGISGNVPASIRRAASTDVMALAPGSLDIVVRRSELALSSEFEQSINHVLDLADSGAQHDFGEVAEAVATSLGREPTRRLELFFRALSEEGIESDLHWRGRVARDARLTHEAAGDIAKWLASAEPATEEIDVLGQLIAADTESGRFVLEADAEQRWEGRAFPPELLHAKELNASYLARLQIVTLTSLHTGAKRQRAALVGLEPPNPPA
jgi:hypothetical protein